MIVMYVATHKVIILISGGGVFFSSPALKRVMREVTVVRISPL